MAPTVLRSTPHEAELLDRTGIVAASLPRRCRADTEAQNLQLFASPAAAEPAVPSGVRRSGVASAVAAVLMFVVAVGGVLGAQRPDGPAMNVAGDVVAEAPTGEPKARTVRPVEPRPEPKPRPVAPPAPAPAPVSQPEPEAQPSTSEATDDSTVLAEPEPEVVEPVESSAPQPRIDLPSQSPSGPVSRMHERLRALIEPILERHRQPSTTARPGDEPWPRTEGSYFPRLERW